MKIIFLGNIRMETQIVLTTLLLRSVSNYPRTRHHWGNPEYEMNWSTPLSPEMEKDHIRRVRKVVTLCMLYAKLHSTTPRGPLWTWVSPSRKRKPKVQFLLCQPAVCFLGGLPRSHLTGITRISAKLHLLESRRDGEKG